jgi:hypothetical protein
MLMAVASTAVAQTSYPPGEETQVKDYGTQRAGAKFTKVDCGYQAGATATIQLNGTPAGSKTVGSDGCVRLEVHVTGSSTITIDGRRYTAIRCSDNVISVTATKADGNGTRRDDNKFTIACNGAVGAGNTARTGQDIAAMAAVGGALVVAGLVIVTVVRRRRDDVPGTPA